MKILSAAFVSFFLLLLSVFCVLQCYIWSVPSNTGVEALRVRIDTEFWNAWIQQNPRAIWLYNTVFRNNDKYVWFPPRVQTIYSERGIIQGYRVFGLVNVWDKDQKLLTLSSYTGKTLYVRFDPDTYGQKAILSVLDAHGTIDTSKAISIVTTLSVSNVDTLFCEGDVISIKTTTWQEVFSATPDRPVIPKELVLSFRLCQNKP